MRPIRSKLLFAATALAVVPLFMSRRFRVARSAVIHAKPETIFPFLNDLRNWQLWSAWGRREEIHFSYSNPPAGLGAALSWEQGRHSGQLRLVVSVPDQRIAYEAEMDGACHFDGAISLEPLGAQTRVLWVCRWTGDPNPYARYADLFYSFLLRRDLDASLENLRDLAESH